MKVVELSVGALLAVAGIRSMVFWLVRDYRARSLGDRLLYTVHVTARVALWFVFAGFFFGYALLDEPQRFTWYFVVPMALAGVQLVSGVLLSREGSEGRPTERAGGPDRADPGALRE